MFKKLKKYWNNLTHPVIGEVWELHSVTNHLSTNEMNRQYEITPNRLKSLIQEHLSKGYEFISIAEVATRMSLRARFINRKFVSITLDDGFRDNYDIAYPIFKKYNIPFCVYVTSGFIEGIAYPHNDSSYQVMSVEQLQEIAQDPLCTIGAHTIHHCKLANMDDKSVIKELVGCKQKLEKWIGTEVVDISSPYGSYTKDIIHHIQELGYKTHVTAWGGSVRKNDSKWAIPRVIIEENRMLK